MATPAPIACLPAHADVAPQAPSPWWHALWEQPGALEGLLVAAVALTIVVVALRLRRLAADAGRRRELADYLLGAEQALHGAADAAARRLGEVVARDPENTHARLLLAKALLDLGQPEAAHKHHVALQAAFGVASSANDAALGGALLAADEPAAARAALVRATQTDPRNRAAWEALFAACLQDRDVDAALAAGRRAAALPTTTRAAAAFQQRVDAIATQRAVGPSALGAAGAWACGRCGFAAATRCHSCPHCEAVGQCQLAEPALVARLHDVPAVQAEIAGDRAHLAALVARLRDDDATAAAQAHADLVALGSRAVPAICDGFGPDAAPADVRLVGALAAGGDAAVPALAAELASGAWLEKVTFGLLARATNRRLRIVDALAAIDSAAARDALRRLADDERDETLLAWMQQALARALPPAGGDDA